MPPVLPPADGRPEGRRADMFAEGDPRRGPFLLAERVEAAAMMLQPGRWHLRNRADWMAVQLQWGRGLSVAQAARMFCIGESGIYNRIEAEDWVSPMSERDRQALARIVWLGGLMRIPIDDENIALLRRASEWRLVEAAPVVMWRRKDAAPAPTPMTLQREIPNDAFYTEADPHRDVRTAVRSRLDEILEEFRRMPDEAEEGVDGGGAEAVADGAGGLEGSAEGDACVGDPGAGGPDSA